MVPIIFNLFVMCNAFCTQVVGRAAFNNGSVTQLLQCNNTNFYITIQDNGALYRDAKSAYFKISFNGDRGNSINTDVYKTEILPVGEDVKSFSLDYVRTYKPDRENTPRTYTVKIIKKADSDVLFEQQIEIYPVIFTKFEVTTHAIDFGKLLYQANKLTSLNNQQILCTYEGSKANLQISSRNNFRLKKDPATKTEIPYIVGAAGLKNGTNKKLIPLNGNCKVTLNLSVDYIIQNQIPTAGQYSDILYLDVVAKDIQ